MKKPLYILTTLFTLSAIASPETDSARIAGGLRSFSDEDWSKISSERSSEKYEVTKGDTLWDISDRLFGDAKVWPKVWEINNSTVLNPHMIEPRMALTFHSGSGFSLPSLVVGASINNAGVMSVKDHYNVAKGDRPGPLWDDRTPFPSGEWRKLPRQDWESVDLNLPADIDKDGFDNKNRVYLRKPATGYELPHYVACAPIKGLGKIEGTRLLTNFAYRGSEVTIAALGAPLEIERVYTLIDPEPSKLESNAKKALSYDILGKIKVLGLQNGTYVGEILSTRETIPRGALLVPEIKRIEKQAPVAGPANVKGTIYADRRTGAFMSGQHKWVYIDRGTRDGISNGMIFRIFQNIDPKTDKQLTRGDVFVQGDAQVFQGCEDFSIGMFIWSRGEVPEKYVGQAMTDMADEKIRFYFNGVASELTIAEPPSAALAPPSGIIDAPQPELTPEIIGPGPSEEPEALAVPDDLPAPEVVQDEDWLDKLDNHKELQGDEENELRELEKFHESEMAKAPPADDGAELPPPPADGELSPPPANELSAEALMNPPPTQSAGASQAPPEEAPLQDESLDDLTPL